MTTDHSTYLKLKLGMRRSDVFRALKLPIERKFRFGSLFGKPNYEGWHLDEGPGSEDFLVAKTLPRLDLRASDGVELFFDTHYQLRALWFEPPFKLSVFGVRFGMLPDEVIALHGEPFDEQLRPEYLCYAKFNLPDGLWLNVEFVDGAAKIISYGLPDTV